MWRVTHCIVAPLVGVHRVVNVWRDHDGLEALGDGNRKALRHALLKPAARTNDGRTSLRNAIYIKSWSIKQSQGMGHHIITNAAHNAAARRFQITPACGVPRRPPIDDVTREPLAGPTAALLVAEVVDVERGAVAGGHPVLHATAKTPKAKQ
jgi:hypothetical protein